MFSKSAYIIISSILYISIIVIEAAPQDLLILIDTTEYEKNRLGPATTNFLCALADSAYPIIASKEIVENSFKKIERYQKDVSFKGNYTAENLLNFIANNFIVKDADHFYLFIPRTQKKNSGLQIESLHTISLNNRMAPTLESSSIVQSLKNIFTHNHEILWNIIIEGHGLPDRSIAGLSIDSFSYLLKFFKDNLSINLLMIESCYALGHTQEVFRYATYEHDTTNQELRIENYPFDIIVASVGESPTLNHTVAVKPFPAPCESHIKNIFDALQSHPGPDWYGLFKNAGFFEKLEIANLLQIRYKNSEHFVPLVSRSDKTFITLSRVMAKTRKNPLEISDATKLIMLYPEEISFPIIVTGSANNAHQPHIISMIHGSSKQRFEKIEIKNKPAHQSNQLDFLCTLFMPPFVSLNTRIFFIKEITFSKPFHFLDYKSIIKCTNVMIEIRCTDQEQLINHSKKASNIVTIKLTFENRSGKKHYAETTYTYNPFIEKDSASSSEFQPLLSLKEWNLLAEPYKIS